MSLETELQVTVQVEQPSQVVNASVFLDSRNNERLAIWIFITGISGVVFFTLSFLLATMRPRTWFVK